MYKIELTGLQIKCEKCGKTTIMKNFIHNFDYDTYGGEYRSSGYLRVDLVCKICKNKKSFSIDSW